MVPSGTGKSGNTWNLIFEAGGREFVVDLIEGAQNRENSGNLAFFCVFLHYFHKNTNPETKQQTNSIRSSVRRNIQPVDSWCVSICVSKTLVSYESNTTKVSLDREALNYTLHMIGPGLIKAELFQRRSTTAPLVIYTKSQTLDIKR